MSNIEDVEMVESGEDDDIEDEEGGLEKEQKKKVYIPGVSRPLKEGEEWEYDPEAYRIFHSFETEFPCLSFDVIGDTLGNCREEFPLTCFLVGGTQAEKSKDNQLIIMRLSNMYGIEREKDNNDDEDDDDESSDEEEENEKQKSPLMHAAVIPHFGDVNRVKTQTIGGSSPVCAVWNGIGKVQIWNLTDSLLKLGEIEGPSNNIKLLNEKPLFSFNGHSAPGYSLAWSPLKNGALASGDNHKKIFIWNMAEAGKWSVDQRALSGHEGAVEDIQWSDTEEPLFASCSTDGSICLWDIRTPQKSCVHKVPNAHDSDVNVISWCRHESLIVSGGDDAIIKVWSLKTIQYNQAVAQFKHHKAPITSVEWHPEESTTLMASGEDDQTTIWDLAVEGDNLEKDDGEKLDGDVPPQLLFVHMGQQEVKEVHWHPQITGLAIQTALDGFNLFRTINV